MRTALMALMLMFGSKVATECGNLCDKEWWKTATPADIRAELDDGADISARDEEHGTTALHWAAAKGTSLIIQTLLDKGADVMASSDDGFTPLYAAAVSGTPANIKVLLAAGADVTAQSKRGSTALHGAALRATPSNIKALLDAGANVLARDQDGWTPLHLAAQCTQCETGVIEILLFAGADTKAKDNDGKTPLALAQKNEELKDTKGFWALNDAYNN